jgi:hypothetical protein
MFSGVSGLRKTVSGFVVCILLAAFSISCNQNYNGFTTNRIIAGNFRAFVSNPLFPNAIGGGSPAIQVMDAKRDLLSVSVIGLTSLSASLASAGMMVVSPDKKRTLVYSSSDNKIGLIDNAAESLSKTITLPGATESFFFLDNRTILVAVPNATVTGSPAGVVQRIDLNSNVVTATLPVPAARRLVPGPNKNQVLVFSDNSDSATLITPSLIDASVGSAITVCTSVQAAACTVPVAMDRPVSAVFNTSGTTAYVMNCGPQCGGAGVGPCLGAYTSCTSVSVLDMTQNPPVQVNSVAVPAATIGLLQGNSLYVAGTPKLAADNDCSSSTPATTATTCGRLTAVNTGSLSASAVAISDGYHDHMEISLNSHLFVGSRNCTNINQPLNQSGSEVRGCLTIADVTSGTVAASGVLVPPDQGDVTGIEPITQRNVVYVCEGGRLRIYDTTTDKLETNPQQPNIIGQAVDVKEVDF